MSGLSKPCCKNEAPTAFYRNMASNRKRVLAEEDLKFFVVKEFHLGRYLYEVDLTKRVPIPHSSVSSLQASGHIKKDL